MAWKGWNIMAGSPLRKQTLRVNRSIEVQPLMHNFLVSCSRVTNGCTSHGDVVSGKKSMLKGDNITHRVAPTGWNLLERLYRPCYRVSSSVFPLLPHLQLGSWSLEPDQGRKENTNSPSKGNFSVPPGGSLSRGTLLLSPSGDRGSAGVGRRKIRKIHVHRGFTVLRLYRLLLPSRSRNTVVDGEPVAARSFLISIVIQLETSPAAMDIVFPWAQSVHPYIP